MSASPEPVCLDCGQPTRVVKVVGNGVWHRSAIYWLIQTGTFYEPRHGDGQRIRLCDTCKVAYPRVRPRYVLDDFLDMERLLDAHSVIDSRAEVEPMSPSTSTSTTPFQMPLTQEKLESLSKRIVERLGHSTDAWPFVYNPFAAIFGFVTVETPTLAALTSGNDGTPSDVLDTTNTPNAEPLSGSEQADRQQAQIDAEDGQLATGENPNPGTPTPEPAPVPTMHPDDAGNPVPNEPSEPERGAAGGVPGFDSPYHD